LFWGLAAHADFTEPSLNFKIFYFTPFMTRPSACRGAFGRVLC